MNTLRCLLSSAILAISVVFAAPQVKAQTPADPVSWQCVVKVLRQSGASYNYTWSGVVLDKDWVLVAGIVAEGVPPTVLRVEDGITHIPIPVASIHFPTDPDPYPWRDGNSYQGNLALLRLSSPISVTPARLPEDVKDTYAGKVGIPVYHQIPGLALYQANGLILTNAQTQADLAGVPGAAELVEPEHLGLQLSVAKTQGPLFVSDSASTVVLVGMKHFNITGAGGQDLTNYPTVFTRITTHLGWICETMGIVPKTKCAPNWEATSIVSGPGPVPALSVFHDGTQATLCFGHQPGDVRSFDGNATTTLGTLGGHILELGSFNDGTGPGLFAGGSIPGEGSIVKWNGTSWTGLQDSGTLVKGTNGDVTAMLAFDDGSGPALYVGGKFTLAGGKFVNNIAKWDGSKWYALEFGLGNTMFSTNRVDALAVYNGQLYAAGVFTETGTGVSAMNIAKWDAVNKTWLAAGSGVNAGIHALKVFRNGPVEVLYAGGHFTAAGSIPASHVAMWNGSTWSALAGGVNDTVNAFAVLNDGTGPSLFVGGDFTTANTSVTANRIAKWDGTTWFALGTGMNFSVKDLAVFDDGTGPSLFASGPFSNAGGVTVNGIAKWGCPPPPPPICQPSWVPPVASAYGYAASFWIEGSKLYIGMYDGVNAFDGTSTTKLGDLHGAVKALTFFKGYLYAGGINLSTPGLGSLGSVARCDIANPNPIWTAAGGLGVPYVNAFETYNLELYAGTGYDATGGGVWKLNDTLLTWSSVAAADGAVLALKVAGNDLCAGGAFGLIGGAVANRVAKFDGAWSPLGGGLGVGPIGSWYNAVRALTTDTNGVLYAAYADSPNGGGVSTWTIGGSAWTTMGSLPYDNTALAFYNDGNGEKLYAGYGYGVSKWDGGWTPLPSEPPAFYGNLMSMKVYDGGDGSALYVGGEFGGNHLHKWKGCTSSQALVAFGTGTPGGNGIQTLSANQAAKINSVSFAFKCDKAPPSSLGLLIDTNVQDLTGSDPFFIDVKLHVDLFASTEVYAFDIVSDASGNATTGPLSIANVPALIGLTYYAQALWVWDPSYSVSLNNLSTSRGLAVTIQP